MQILVVEDDLQLADMLSDVLSEDGYTVAVAQNGEAAWEAICTETYHVVILDLMLPKLDGISLCQRLREQQIIVPILMLTARDTLADKIIGLDAGADDYLVKPFEMPELRARIRALLRRNNIVASSTLQWGHLALNQGTYDVTYANTSLHLTPKEFALLELLMTNGRRVLSRAGIIEHLWSIEEVPTEETVKSHIKGLRHKLREAGAPDDFIETVHGIGYRLQLV